MRRYLLVLVLIVTMPVSPGACADPALPAVVTTWLQANSTSDENTRNALIDQILAADFQSGGMGGGVAGGRDAFKQFLNMAHSALEDYQLTLLDSAMAADKVWLRLRASGRHTGTLMGAEPTGRPVAIGLAVVLQVAQGRIVREWQLSDVPALGRQLTGD